MQKEVVNFIISVVCSGYKDINKERDILVVSPSFLPSGRKFVKTVFKGPQRPSLAYAKTIVSTRKDRLRFTLTEVSWAIFLQMFHRCAGSRINKGIQGETSPFKLLSTLRSHYHFCFIPCNISDSGKTEVWKDVEGRVEGRWRGSFHPEPPVSKRDTAFVEGWRHFNFFLRQKAVFKQL